MKDISYITHIIQQHQSGCIHLFHQDLTMVCQVHSIVVSDGRLTLKSVMGCFNYHSIICLAGLKRTSKDITVPGTSQIQAEF